MNIELLKFGLDWQANLLMKEYPSLGYKDAFDMAVKMHTELKEEDIEAVRQLTS